MRPLDDQAIAETLKAHCAVVTQNRIAILKILASCSGGASIAQIRKMAPQPLDRISIYRTLQLFSQKGIVRMIPCSKGSSKYVLNDYVKQPGSGSGSDPVVYFNCKHCGCTELIAQAKLPRFPVSPRHTITNSYILLEGICPNCS